MVQNGLKNSPFEIYLAPAGRRLILNSLICKRFWLAVVNATLKIKPHQLKILRYSYVILDDTSEIKVACNNFNAL